MLVTADLPGTGGSFRGDDRDFVVTELPAYEPAGTGGHVFARVEKRGLGTLEAVRRIARALDVRPDDVGTAGLKDRHALTVQSISLPPPVTPEAAKALTLEGIRILGAERHPHKLKTGHLKGNHFSITVRNLAIPVDEAVARAQAILLRLAEPPGLPNFYGEQRFGTDRETAALGRALLRGEKTPGGGREKRLYISALQSELFNAYLEQRMKDGAYRRVITGDILRKMPAGGSFETTDPAVDQPRLTAGEIAPTGPMFGVDMRAPAAGTEAAEREAAVLAAAGLQASDFARVSRLAEGTRRAIGVRVDKPKVVAADDGFWFSFELPPGAYATQVAAEVMKA